ncbi:MAG: hypothetical protein AUI47_03210 [Acidobacteria bacterium 13_1_40CM_2_68_5]|nr:MAG: hypothetical protein AUI47_03210 [Acidobacteria bacterium 13_1_40CM_2_68_5]OLE67660.1 MAG: hypothetical protein AUG09_01325 [Acidobacteria bacterium 13_1_20CM_2_68_7]
MADDAPDKGRGKGSISLPVLLADRQEVAFVATPRGIESLRVPRRYWGMQVGVVAIPVSDEEVRATEIAAPSDAGAWPRVVTRPDLLSPALSRLMGGEHAELSLQPGRDGLKASLVTGPGDEQPFPVAPKDALGFLAAVFQHAPRGVVKTAGGRARRVLLAVRPAARAHEYRIRIAGVVDAAPPSTLADVGLSPAVLEILLETIERRSGILLVSGGPASGRSTTLDLLALTLASRGRGGGRIGPRARTARPDLPWLAETLSDWPFPESLLAAAPEFILVEHLEGSADLVLAARLAASGCLVLAGAPAADPEALAKSAARDLAAGSAPAVPVAVLGQTIARTVCRGCLRWSMLPAAQAQRLGFHRRDLDAFERRGGLALARGAGCGDCAGTGCSGLTGIHELVVPEAGVGSLPRMREEGWRKVVQGQACVDDVISLSGAQRPLRTLREIMMHAGASPAAPDLVGAPQGEASGTHDTLPGGTRPAHGTAGVAAVMRPGPALAETETLSHILRDARGQKPVDPARLTQLANAIAARASSDSPLVALVAPTDGFRLTTHSVNVALIAGRIWAALGNGEDARLALLALVHDVGLIGAGVDPDAELPLIASEEAIDPTGRRHDAGPFLKTLGHEAAGLADPVRTVHLLLKFDLPSAEERARADSRAQVVALASLVELHMHGSAEGRPADMHDVTSLVMEQHGRRFSPALFRALLKAVPIFPIGSLVELSSGDLARVVSLNEDNHFRPRVEITASASGQEHGERRVIDLARAPFLHIRHRVTPTASASRVAV